jgi:transposase-like protein
MGRKSQYRKFTEAYRELAVRRLRECENVSELCREMRISRQLLYQWRDRLERKQAKLDPDQATQLQLRAQVARRKQSLAEKTLEVDFFKSALQKVEALRQASTGSGEAASTSRLGK